MINFSYISQFKSKHLKRWLYELANFELSIKDGSYVYKEEVKIEKDYDQAFCIAIEFARRTKCQLQVSEKADGDSEDCFVLSIYKKTKRIDKTLTFKTIKS